MVLIYIVLAALFWVVVAPGLPGWAVFLLVGPTAIAFLLGGVLAGGVWHLARRAR